MQWYILTIFIKHVVEALKHKLDINTTKQHNETYREITADFVHTHKMLLYHIYYPC